jgi:hypothetical protein
MSCHARDAEPGSNLCLDCAESLGIAPLLDLHDHGVSIELRDGRLWGLASGPWLHEGEIDFVLDASDGEEGVLRCLPLDEIRRIERCVRDALLPTGGRTEEFLAWERRERQAEAIMSAAEAAEGAAEGAAGGGNGEVEEEDEDLWDEDDDDCWEQGDSAADGEGDPAKPPATTRDLEALLAELDALAEPPSEDRAIEELVAEGIIVGPRAPAVPARGDEVRGRIEGGDIIRWRLRRLLRRLRLGVSGRGARSLAHQRARDAEVEGR